MTQSETKVTQERSVKNRQITLMLLFVSCFYLVSNLPREINSQFWPAHPNLSAPDLRKLTLEIVVFIEASNNAINFYVYAASCRKFRTTLESKFTKGVEERSKTIATDVTNQK